MSFSLSLSLSMIINIKLKDFVSPICKLLNGIGKRRRYGKRNERRIREKLEFKWDHRYISYMVMHQEQWIFHNMQYNHRIYSDMFSVSTTLNYFAIFFFVFHIVFGDSILYNLCKRKKINLIILISWNE